MDSDDSGFKLRAETDGSETPIRHGLLVGRGDDCGLVIRLGVVSRQHARFNVVDGVPWLEDLGSTNGTTVNGERVTSATRLKPADIVCFDDIAYQVLTSTAVVPPPVDRDRTLIGARPLPSASELANIASSTRAAAAQPGSTPLPAQPSPTPLPAQPIATPLPAQPGSTLSPAQPSSTPSPAQPSRAPGPAAPLPPAVQPGPAAPPVAGRHAESSPGMPLSWAESNHLESSSHTQALPILLRQIGQKSGNTEGLIEAARARDEERQPRLIGLNPPFAGQIFGLQIEGNSGKWELGRDAGADICLPDESVSGRHAQLVLEGGRWKVVNLMSVNGTFVNGRKVLSAFLQTTDKIRLGNVELAFDAGEGAGVGSRSAAEPRPTKGLMARLRALLARPFGRS